MKTLLEIFDKYKCDKGNIRHRYDRVYEPIFNKLRYEKINLLEIGILRGESALAHLEYFPNATIYGIDIFGRVPTKDVSVLKEERFKWCKCDSIIGPNEDFKKISNNIYFDIIIDDGLHFHYSQLKTFENFIPYLKAGGKYFIEDVWPFDKMSAQQKQHPWIKKNISSYSDEQYTKLLTNINKYDVHFHDYRFDSQPDTFIIEITK